ncbi:MAG: hypothetical protein GT589_08720 [Peptoclostridium sp.]|uniref:hypothetical protein n=1 Tax=Peptoclostridium sp. TaxID=1904860 RepID=UPI00139B7C32|nr:hypothetical protein [Peptoclostridium sp.]MZQ76215.1 hypothetical protein [Peptoclostridium sp.]
MDNRKTINSYKYGIEDFEEVSPFELVDTLMVRDRIEKTKSEFTEKEWKEIEAVDDELKSKGKLAHDHLMKIEYKTHKEPKENWWWHVGE